MSTRELVIQGVREWLIAALALTDLQIVPAPVRGPRPALPYLTVGVLTLDLEEAQPWTTLAPDAGDELVETTTALRGATVSLQAYGRGADVWLEDLALSTNQPADLPFSIVDPGSIVDLSVLVDTDIEARSGRDLTLQYLRTATRAADAADTLEVVQTFTSEVGPDLTFTTTVTL